MYIYIYIYIYINIYIYIFTYIDRYLNVMRTSEANLLSQMRRNLLGLIIWKKYFMLVVVCSSTSVFFTVFIG